MPFSFEHRRCFSYLKHTHFLHRWEGLNSVAAAEFVWMGFVGPAIKFLHSSIVTAIVHLQSDWRQREGASHRTRPSVSEENEK